MRGVVKEILTCIGITTVLCIVTTVIECLVYGDYITNWVRSAEMGALSYLIYEHFFSKKGE